MNRHSVHKQPQPDVLQAALYRQRPSLPLADSRSCAIRATPTPLAQHRNCWIAGASYRLSHRDCCPDALLPLGFDGDRLALRVFDTSGHAVAKSRAESTDPKRMS